MLITINLMDEDEIISCLDLDVEKEHVEKEHVESLIDEYNSCELQLDVICYHKMPHKK